MANKLYFGDNLDILRSYIDDESVDLIYLDPPFNSQASYNMLFRTPTGEPSEAQAEAFQDTWHWGENAEAAYDYVMASGSPAAGILSALRSFLRENDMMAYLAMMTARLIEMHRVLKSTGSLYLHCDPTASHYLKILLDGIFGAERFLNEIVWKRTNARGTTGRWPRIHDLLLCYAKGPEFTFHSQKAKADKAKLPHTLVMGPDGKKYQTYELSAAGVTKEGESGRPWRGHDPSKMGRHWANSHATMERWDRQGLIHWPKNGGFPRRRASEPFDPEAREITMGDVWTDIDRLNQTAKERLGYPTQKPLSLLERIVKASSNEGDVVLDPFCGCGTAPHAAQKLGRRWLGIDITHYAITLVESRVRKAYPEADIEVVGRPRDLADARALAARDKFQFQFWACWLVGVQNYRERRGGGDRGIDGVLFFRNLPHGTGRVIVSVKGGENLSPQMVRDLRGTVERESAELGALITLTEPTPKMVAEAAAASFVRTAQGHFPRLQIITIEQLFEGVHPLPRPYRPEPVELRPRRRVAAGRQLEMLLPVAGKRSKDVAAEYTDPDFLGEVAAEADEGRPASPPRRAADGTVEAKAPGKRSPERRGRKSAG